MALHAAAATLSGAIEPANDGQLLPVHYLSALLREDVSFSTPTGTERIAGAILKGAKTFCEGVLISVGRQTVCDQWACRHQRAIIFHGPVLLQLGCDQITAKEISKKKKKQQVLTESMWTCSEEKYFIKKWVIFSGPWKHKRPVVEIAKCEAKCQNESFKHLQNID